MNFTIVLMSFLFLGCSIALIISTLSYFIGKTRKAPEGKQKKRIVAFGIGTVASLVLMMVVFPSVLGRGDSDTTLEKDPKNGGETINDSDTVKTNDAIELAVPGLTEIIKSVGIDPKDAEGLERIDDWTNGPRYSFRTNGTTARVYCNTDGSVEKIEAGTDIDLYRAGYETWNIENFLVEDALKENLILRSQNAVSSYLNYPASADFPLLGWSFGREFDKYRVSSYVEAENTFGVPSKMEFNAIFVISGETIKLIRLQLDGETLKDELSDYPSPERKKLESVDEIGKDGEIRIVDEQLGEYGEKVKLDSGEYYWYHVPAGTYTVTGNSKSCTVYVDKNEITRNSSGRVEMENVSTTKIDYGEQEKLSISEDEHIFLTMYADITLVPTE